MSTQTKQSLHTPAVVHYGKSFISQSFSRRIHSLSLDMPVQTPEPVATYYNEPPWDMVEMEIRLELPSKLTKADLPGELRSETLDMLSTQYSNFVKIFTDGSVDLRQNKSGAGFFNQNSGEIFFAPSNGASSMDAELLAINAALLSCLDQEERHICILTDSKAAMEALRMEDPGDYSCRISELRALLHGLKAVSYTHLDVYKRQILCHRLKVS